MILLQLWPTLPSGSPPSCSGREAAPKLWSIRPVATKNLAKTVIQFSSLVPGGISAGPSKGSTSSSPSRCGSAPAFTDVARPKEGSSANVSRVLHRPQSVKLPGIAQPASGIGTIACRAVRYRHQTMWCEARHRILGVSLPDCSIPRLPKEHRRVLSPSSCSVRGNGRQESGARSGDFFGARFYLARIARRSGVGYSRMCVAAKAKNGEMKSAESEEDLLTKIEIHGRRTRVGRPKPSGPYNNVMLQGFNWESHKPSRNGRTWWQVLKCQVEDFRAVGITDIWLPPVSQAVDRQGYLPGELYNLDASRYGTGVQLKELIDELHLHGIFVLADIVINHRSGGMQDNKGHWNVFKGGNRDKRLNWGPWAVVDDDVYDSGGKGKHDTGESYAAAPDLDHTNKQVQDELTDWMNWLKAEIGFDGWRFDFVKGYAPRFTELYCSRTNPTMAVGELWTSMSYYDGQLSWDQNGHRQELCNWIDGTSGTCSAFDFTTKGILQRAVESELWRLKDEQNHPPGLIGWWPEMAVTFLDNHDTGSTQRHWAFPDGKVMQGYAYILTHPGLPCIFYDHLYQFQLLEEIKKLVELRKRHRISTISKVNIQKAEGDIYVAKIDDRVILKLGTRYDMGSLLPAKDQWKMTLKGRDYAIWETTLPLPPLPEPDEPVEQIDEVIIEHMRPKQPVYITSKMSAETRNRILKDFPELVDVAETQVETKKPSAKHQKRRR